MHEPSRQPTAPWERVAIWIAVIVAVTHSALLIRGLTIDYFDTSIYLSTTAGLYDVIPEKFEYIGIDLNRAPGMALLYAVLPGVDMLENGYSVGLMRAFTLLLAWLGPVFMLLLARRLLPRWAAWAAVVLFVGCRLFSHYLPFVLPDTLGTTGVLGCLYFYMRFSDRPNIRDGLLVAASLGLAIAIKPTNAALGLSLGLAEALALLGVFRTDWAWSTVMSVVGTRLRGAIPLFLALGIFFAIQAMAIIVWFGWDVDIPGVMRGIFRANLGHSVNARYATDAPFEHWLYLRLVYGPVVLALFGAGLVRSLRSLNRTALIVVCTALTFYLVFEGRVSHKEARYLLPGYPFVALGALYGLTWITERLQQRSAPKVPTWLAPATLVAVTLAIPLYHGVRQLAVVYDRNLHVPLWSILRDTHDRLQPGTPIVWAAPALVNVRPTFRPEFTPLDEFIYLFGINPRHIELFAGVPAVEYFSPQHDAELPAKTCRGRVHAATMRLILGGGPEALQSVPEDLGQWICVFKRTGMVMKPDAQGMPHLITMHRETLVGPDTATVAARQRDGWTAFGRSSKNALPTRLSATEPLPPIVELIRPEAQVFFE